MNEDMKVFEKVLWASVRSLTGAFLMLLLVALLGCDRGLKQENERLREELARQQQWVPLIREQFRDSLEAVRQSVRPVADVKAVLTDEDRRLLKELGVRVKSLESLQQLGIETEGTVVLKGHQDSIGKDKNGNVPLDEGAGDAQEKGSWQDRDSVLCYRDEWVDFRFHTSDRLLHFSLKDSLSIAIERQYRHRLLWMRWGLKGYTVDVVNFNPHSRVKCNRYVKGSR